ncbi:MAG: response regulator [bacterium]|nr:response regulator [bacterium]
MNNTRDLKNSILIVDDDESTCKSLKLIFNRKGYKVDIALSGEKALEKIQNRFFNLALLDIRLPDIEGADLITPFIKLQPNIAIIIITGYASMETAMWALNKNVFAYITKPLIMDELLAKIDEAMGKTKGKKSLSVKTYSELKTTKDETKAIKTHIKLYKAIKYIKENYKKPKLLSEEIAVAVGMQYKSFSRMWKKTMNTSISEFINNLKIEASKTMLTNTPMYISQIAYKLGLTHKHFCRLFKSKVGISPNQYRNSSLPTGKKNMFDNSTDS